MIQVSRLPTVTPVASSGPADRRDPVAGELRFGQYLAAALRNLEAVQVEAARAAEQLAAGQAPDLAQVMIASEKATLSLQLALAIRNKVLEAYQEIMRMPL